MTREPNEMQQAVSRTLRDSLGKLQRTSDELNQAVADLVSACASTRPSNSLSPILRAQTSAASLAASLEVLARFITSSLQLAVPAVSEGVAPSVAPSESEAVPKNAEPAAGLHIVAAPEAASPEPVEEADLPVPLRVPAEVSIPLAAQTPLETVAPLAASDVVEESGPADNSNEPVGAASYWGNGQDNHQEQFQATSSDQFQENFQQELTTFEPPSPPAEVLPVAVAAFELSALPPEEQELHRRANRVAKVSMQDIKMLRPNDVRLGREQRDLCWRLRDDLEKAHKEYDRRFQTILVHPVDYFYDWMVEILAEGDPQVLGEYPYPSPVLRH